jgi:hypothetical protein
MIEAAVASIERQSQLGMTTQATVKLIVTNVLFLL